MGTEALNGPLELLNARRYYLIEFLAEGSTLKACFVEGVPLLVPGGSKRIEAFVAGDKLFAQSEHDEHGPVEVKVVEEVFVGHAPIMWVVAQGQRIGTTHAHPFYVFERGWVAAEVLRVGDRLRGHDGQWVAADGADGVTTLFTTGLSDRPMNVPDEPGAHAYRFAELFVQLPAHWNYREVRDLAQAWPVHWLRTVAKYPHRNDTWLGAPLTVISAGDPLGPGVKFDSWLLCAEHKVPAPEGVPTRLYRLFPLYPEERELEAEHGLEALLQAFDGHDHELIVDPTRPNVAIP